MRKTLFFILLGIVFLSGCNTGSPLDFSEISKESLNKDIQSFFQDVKDENGVHLYYDNKNDAMFIYLNGSNVIQGDKATYFTGFDVEEDNNTLNLLYKSKETSDFSNSSLEHELFYRINLDKKYDVVNVFNNGNQTSFTMITENQ